MPLWGKNPNQFAMMSNLRTGSCPQGSPVNNNCPHCCRVSGNPGNFLEFLIPSEKYWKYPGILLVLLEILNC